jgi:2-polyprenyl-6-methoxyphenol hydroxylase-like FAD-dependent oxidoreductase
MTRTVLIVGAGPVGLTAATELARYGIAVRIVDKSPQRTDKSKAVVLWSRTLELLDRGGGSAPFREAGFNVHAVNVVADDGSTMGHVTMDTVDSPYPFALMLPQSETERLLEDRLRGFGVEVERNVEVTRLAARADGAEAVLRHADGTEETLHADWLLGCDGAHSIVRSTLGIEFVGETMMSDWMLADIHMRGYPFSDTEASVYWHHNGVFVIFPLAPGRYRVIANLPMTAGQRSPDPTLEQVQAIIDERGPAGMVAFDPVWLAGFRINGRKVSNYRAGRMFLLGDAAHIHSPAGGQGMNTGMQDAFNLSWKLALVIKGICSDALLDSYSPERSKVGDEVLKDAGRITTVGTLRNPVAQGVRNFVAHFMLGLPAFQEKFAEVMTEVSIGYSDSPLNGPARGGAKCPSPGKRVVPVSGPSPVGAGSTPRFALFAEPGEAVDGLLKRFPTLLDPEIRPAFATGGITLVRPDGYAACSAIDASDITDYLEGLR